MCETLFGYPNAFPAFDANRPAQIKDAPSRPPMRNYVTNDLLPHAFIWASGRRPEIDFAKFSEIWNLSLDSGYRGLVIWVGCRDPQCEDTCFGLTEFSHFLIGHKFIL